MHSSHAPQQDLADAAFWRRSALFYFLFFNRTATTEIYPLSLHDALPIFSASRNSGTARSTWPVSVNRFADTGQVERRSEEHTSELQSRFDLVCRLLLEKKKKIHENSRTIGTDAIKQIIASDACCAADAK